jgi:hypothetical protein
MKQFSFRITILLFMLFVSTGLMAQSRLYIHAKDGTTTYFPLNEIRKVTFPSRSITVYQNDGSTLAFPFIELRQARFTEFVSDSKSLELPQDHRLTLFPNPVNSELTINIGAISGATVEIRIVNVQGKTEFIRNEQILPGNNQITMQLSDLQQGLYICLINDGKSTEIRKFLKN